MPNAPPHGHPRVRAGRIREQDAEGTETPSPLRKHISDHGERCVLAPEGAHWLEGAPPREVDEERIASQETENGQEICHLTFPAKDFNRFEGLKGR